MEITTYDYKGYEIDDSPMLNGTVSVIPHLDVGLFTLEPSKNNFEFLLDDVAEGNEDKKQKTFLEDLDYIEKRSIPFTILTPSWMKEESFKFFNRPLRDKLETLEDRIKDDYISLSLGKDEPWEYLTCCVTKDEQTPISTFLSEYFNYLKFRADKILQINPPNSVIDTKTLIQDLKKKIDLDIPPINEFGYIPTYHSPLDKKLKLFNTPYENAIVLKDSSSFTYDANLKGATNEIIKDSNAETPLEKSKAIFDWITNNIEYAEGKKEPFISRRGALQTFYDLEGVCSESAALQVTMERLAGNKASLVYIETGKPTKHACAAHFEDNGSIKFIDTTHRKGYDVLFEDFKILTDENGFAGYK